MEILDGFDNSAILRAVTLLKEGGIVAFPTETVYGLGADALDPYAVAKIFEAKRRPHFDPLIIHLGGKDWIFRYGDNLSPYVQVLADRFWPGPLTMIVQKKPVIPDIVTAGLSTVAVRMPSHEVALKLITALDRPIAAPSANPFGYVSPTRAAHVAGMLKGRIPLVLDGGSSRYGIESTIVSFEDDGVVIRRHGSISEEELADCVPVIQAVKANQPGISPGELPFHYAPMKPLVIVRGVKDVKTERSAFLAFRVPETAPISKQLRVLSETGDLKEAAANFFSSLIDLDHQDVDVIYAERVPESGIGKAIMERLRKAAKKGEILSAG